MATQIAFAQGFLDQLNTLPITITADHVEDPRRFPARPAFTLAKMPTPMAKRVSLAPGAERSITVSLKSARNPPLDISLPAQALTVSIADLRAVVVERTGAALPKVKLLHRKKPVVDSKTLKDLAGESDTRIELAVMIMGGAAAIAKDEPVVAGSPDAGAGEADDRTEKILRSDEFWADLHTFVESKLKNEKKTAELLKAFKAGYAAKK